MEGALLMAVPYKGVPIFNEDGTFRKEDDIVPVSYTHLTLPTRS